MGYTRRQLVAALLTANAVRPLRGNLSPLGFAIGWPTGELAPQLLALTAVDTIQALVRGKASRAGLGLAALTAAGVGYLVRDARKAGEIAEQQLAETLGADYLDEVIADPAAADLAESLPTPLRDLIRPFAMMRPDVERIADVNYREGGSRGRLDIYRRRDVDPKDAPVLIQVHGGGWTIGDKSQQGLLLMNRMAARGWVCVAVNYRLAPKHPFPAQIIDVKRAIAWTREHIGEYGGDPSYMVITGGSAGGHLAALVGLTANDPAFQPGFEDSDTSVQACVPFYGAYDLANVMQTKAGSQRLDRFLARTVFKSKDRDAFESATPLLHARADAPPFFVIHGAHDSLVPVAEAREMVARLRDVSKEPVVYAELPGAQHAFDVFHSIRSAHVIRGVERFLRWVHATRDQS
jgi:acetyl esterase/lipase